MKTRSRIVSAFAVAATTGLLLTGCFAQPKVTATQNPQTVTNAQTSGKPTAAPTPNANLKDDTAQKAATLNVNAVPGYSKAETQKAVASAIEITRTLVNEKPLLDGSWAQDNWDPDFLFPFTVNTMTTAAYQHLHQFAGNVTTNENDMLNVVVLTPFLPGSNPNWKVCSLSTSSCQEPGYPQIGNSNYGAATDGTVFVDVPWTDRVPVLYNGKQGYITLSGTLHLNMTKNPSYKAAVGTYPYIISGWKGTYDRSKFVG